MSRGVKRLAAGILAVVAGAVVIASAGLLIGDDVAAILRAAPDLGRVEALRTQGENDAEAAAPLHDEYERQTDRSLVVSSRSEQLGWVLLVAAAVFVTAGKWWLALRTVGPGLPAGIAVCAGRAGGAVEGEPRAGERAAGHVQLPIVEQIDLSRVDAIVAEVGRGSEATIPILQALQTRYRYLPDPALRRVCELTTIPPAQLAGVASFYSQFRHTPIGKHVVTVCHGTACHVAGAPRITDELRRGLNIADGEDTDAGREFTVQAVPCLGCCTLAPVMQVDGVTHGHVRPDTAETTARESAAQGERRAGNGVPHHVLAGEAPAGEIRLGMGSCCIANGSDAVHDALEAALASAGVSAAVKRVGCVGMCHQTPFIEVVTAGDRSTRYRRVRPEHVAPIVQRHFKPAGLAARVGQGVRTLLASSRERSLAAAVRERQLELRDPPVADFLGRQRHIATEHYGALEPLDLDEYLEHEGFEALERCRTRLSEDEIIEQIRQSGLRGRGGAGFPTWRKWAAVRGAPGELKYIICNGDEGDPGAFMDRMLMESYPYRVIEGLAIAARATGATQGVFYIRAEYPLAVERMTAALENCAARGLIGPDRGLELRVAQGAGAFVCGEESALIASLEGQRGMPTLRPPFPAEQGLHGRPTLVNNVETFTLVPWIIRNGPAAFAALGTPTSSGTKVFALTGKIARGGLIEVPMGITIREIVEQIGGGIRGEEVASGTRPHAFKAVQVGGPSGGCIPAELADTPVDYEALAGVGAMMGSGGLVVLDETDCMVDMARYFLAFTQDQSCGKCVPCRIGTRRMLEILERLTSGTGRANDLDELEHLARMVKAGSLCGLGKTAPNPVLTTLKYFRGEYEAHLEGRCPAGKCTALIRYEVTEACTGCTLCAQHCPAGAIPLTAYARHEIDDARCTRCDVCRTQCPEDAIRIVSPCRV